MKCALVIAAHPDDEVLGCGGTVALLTSQGVAVDLMILGEGITSRFEDRQEAPARELAQLHAKARASAKHLGFREVILCDLPDNRFDTVPLLEIIKKVEAQIQKSAPEVVFTQHGGDLNRDHETTFRAVLTATRPMQGRPVHALFAYPVGSSTEWAFERFSPVFRAGKFVEIEATLERKIEAMEMYESEARPAPHPRSPEVIRATAAYWGSRVGMNAAEVFEVIWDRRGLLHD